MDCEPEGEEEMSRFAVIGAAARRHRGAADQQEGLWAVQ
jgi:hypothetical protein